MTEIQFPETHTIEGIFLLSSDDLKELDAILAKAKKEINKEISRQLTKAVEAKIRENQSYQFAKKPPEEVRKDLKERYPFNIGKHVISISCKSNKTVTGSSFEEIASSSEMQNEIPERAFIEIRRADIQLSLKLLSFSFPIPAIEITCSPRNKAFAHRIIKLIVDWAESKRKYAFWNTLRFTLLSLSSLLLFLILFAVLPASIYRPDAPLPGKASLEEKAFNLSKKGIDETNQAQAIDILLRLTTNNYEVGKPEGIRVRFVPQIITLLIVDLGLFIFGRLCPRSVLGIGLGCRTIHRYQIIGKCIYVLFGLWIFAIGTSAIGSWLYDLIKGSSS